jgi:hypothetical protein
MTAAPSLADLTGPDWEDVPDGAIRVVVGVIAPEGVTCEFVDVGPERDLNDVTREARLLANRAENRLRYERGL